MKKKYFMSLLTCMMVAFMSFSVASCSSDDDPIGDGGDSRIIGTWYKVEYTNTTAWKFEKNGTCKFTEWGNNEPKDWSKYVAGSWKVSGNKLTAIITYDDGDYDKDIYTYSISEDGKTLTLNEGDYGMSGIYTKE